MSSLVLVDAIGGGIAGGREQLSMDSDGTLELRSAALLDPRDRAGRWAAAVADRGGLDAVIAQLPVSDPATQVPPGATLLRCTLGNGRTVALNANEHAVAPLWRPLVEWWRSMRVLVLAHPTAVVELRGTVVGGAVRLTVANPGTAPLDVAIDEAGFSLVEEGPDGSWTEVWRNAVDDRLGLITTDGRIVGGVLTPARLDAGAVVQAAFAGAPPVPAGAFLATMRGELIDDTAGPEPFSLTAVAAVGRDG